MVSLLTKASSMLPDTVTVSVTVFTVEVDDILITVVDGVTHVELSGVEYPGTMAKVDELEHSLEFSLDGKLGKCFTKHFAIRVGTSGLRTYIRYLLVSLFS